MPGRVHFEMPNDEPLILSSHIVDAPRELVWDAFTKAEHIVRWWGPSIYTMTVPEWDVRPGGKWKIVQTADGRSIEFSGEFLEVVKPSRLVRTARFNNSPPAIEEMEFEDVGGKTLLKGTSRFPSIAARDGMSAGGRMAEGANEAFARLDALLKTL
jgi:uncharacterized protein YndB with AHSA1/START domain